MIPIKLTTAPIKVPDSINVFLLIGEPLTLVDTGFRTEAAWESLNTQLNGHGYKIEDIKQLVLTHAHPDHYGLGARIVANTDVKVLAHKDATPLFLRYKLEWERENNFLLETLKKTGAPEEALVKRLTIKKGGDPLVEPIQVTQLIRDGDMVTGGVEAWEVMELPGHSPGVIGLLRRETGELISSDHLLPETNSRPGLYRIPGRNDRDRSYMGKYIDTMARIARMSLVTAWPSHGDPISSVRDLTLEWIGKHRQRAEMVASPLVHGDKTAYQIWKTHFPNILPFDPVKGLIEVITYLDLLISEREIQTYYREEFEYYQLIH
jgi:glyoxylase-like metal-dependent hydrolase (beta-lactamase superfamily II)